jgi:hypothetical protein
MALVSATFDAAVSKATRRRLDQGQALAAIVLVPSAEWVSPMKMKMYFKDTFGSRWQVQHRYGSNRRHDSFYGCPNVSGDLSRGISLVGIAADIDLLPRSLAGAADITVRLAQPDAAGKRDQALHQARSAESAERHRRSRSSSTRRRLPARHGGGEDRATPVGDVVDPAWRDQGRRLPDLLTAVEYGEARSVVES